MDTKRKNSHSRSRSRSPSRKRVKHGRSHSSKKKRRHNSDTSESDSSSEDSTDQHEHDSDSGSRERHRRKSKSSKTKIKKKRSRDSSDSPIADKKRKKEKKKRKKKKHKKKSKKIPKDSQGSDVLRTATETGSGIIKNINDDVMKNQEKETIGPAPRIMTPMTKEEWEKKQSVIRHVYDPETGRNRLVKGDGEILEEIVSKERHHQINKQATIGDGLYYQSAMGLLKR